MRYIALTVLVALSMGATSCVSTADYNRKEAARKVLEKERDAMRDALREVGLEKQAMEARIAGLEKNAADAAWIKDKKKEIADLLAKYQEGGSLAIPGVEAINTPEGVSFRVEGEIVFASGQAVVTDTGKATLRQVLAELRKQGKKIRVEGHTDSDPIRRSRWKSNLELSSARSVAVAQFLIAEGLAGDMVSVAGYGEHRPAVEGTDDAAKRRNRRVEILMLNR